MGEYVVDYPNYYRAQFKLFKLPLRQWTVSYLMSNEDFKFIGELPSTVQQALTICNGEHGSPDLLTLQDWNNLG